MGRNHKLFVLCIISILTHPVFSQLSGNYLVDPGGSGQYTTINAAVSDLNTQGVSGPVTINIAPGTYNEQFVLHDVTGTNATNKITLQSNTGNASDVEIQFASNKDATNYIANIYNVGYLTMQNLTFRALGTQYSTALSLRGGVTHSRFQYLKIRGYLGGSGGNAYALEDIYLIDSATINFTPSNDIYIGHNDIDSCVSGIFCISLASPQSRQLLIEQNVFGAINSTCIFAAFQDSCTITHNWFDSTYQQSNAISSNASGNLEVSNNYVLNVRTGLTIGGLGPNGGQIIVANNFITSQQEALFGGSDSIKVYHNTLKSQSSNAIKFGTHTNARIYNNIFYTEAGYAAALYSNTSTDQLIDNNCYFNATYDSLILVDSLLTLTYYSDLQQFSTALAVDSHSVHADPGFIGPNDLHITSLALRDAGKPLGGAVPFDIDGDSRDLLTPDIGADELTAFANLVPDHLGAPTSQGLAGHAFQISYTGQNIGTLHLNGPWKDGTYLSPDSMLSAGDTLLGEIANNFVLGGGQSYNPSPTVILPVDSSGNMYLILVLDHENILPEDWSDNQTHLALQITIPNRPDLVVDTVYGPANVFSGQDFTLHWTVTNVGSESTQVSWKDFIYVNSDSAYLAGPTFNPDSAYYDSQNNPIGLKPGESYTMHQTIHTPLQYAGPLFYAICTDQTDQVVEENNTLASNLGVSHQVYVQQSPLPNLQVTQASAPSTSFAGEDIIVTYEVKNVGSANTLQDAWRDYIYLLADSTIDAAIPLIDLNKRADRLTSIPHLGELPPGASYQVIDTVTLPKCIASRFYLYIYADGNHQSHEITKTDNYYRTDSITIVSHPNPDLEPQAISVTTSNPASGQYIDLEFTVANTGFTPISVASHWYDKIYLSRDNQLDPRDDMSLRILKWDNGLDTSKTYIVNTDAYIHDSLFGTFYFILFTDAIDNICEYPYDSNNVLASAPVNISLSPQADLAVTLVNPVTNTVTAGVANQLDVTISNQGAGNPSNPKWTDGYYLLRQGLPIDSAILLQRLVHDHGAAPGSTYQETVYLTVPTLTKPGTYQFLVFTDDKDGVYETGLESNNTQTSNSFQVVRDLSLVSDLAITQVTLPAMGYAGEFLDVNYQVVNLNAIQTKPSDWFEQASVFNEQGDRIAWAKSQHLGYINGYGSYTNKIQVRLPYGQAGNFSLKVRIDTTDRLIEYVRTNHARSAQVQVVDPPRPDLVIDYITSDTTVIAGQNLLLNFQVKNQGPGDTRESFWTDRGYLSKDFYLDDQDHPLASSDHTGIINAGSTYLGIENKRVPLYLSGDFLLLVKTDANEEVYEGQEEFNNVGVVGKAVTVLPPLPVDLIPTSLSVSQVGSSYYMDYTVSNLGSNPAIGAFIDKLFVSADSIWDEHDPIVETVAHDYDTIPPLDSVGEHALLVFPPLVPGNYYLFVQVDAFHNLYDTDRDNNRQRMPATLALDNIQVILPDSTYPGQFEKGAGMAYYKIAVPQQQAMLVTVANMDAFHPEVPTELYGRHEAIPDFTRFDYRHDRPFQSKQEVVITSLDSLHTDYMLTRMSTAVIDTSEQLDYSIRADFRDFGIVETAPESGGNYGTILLDIKGFDFNDSMDIQLVNVADTIHPYMQFSPNTTIVHVYFDLVDHNPGYYDLLITKPSQGATARKDSAFQVVAGGEPQLFSQVTSPAQAVINTTVPFYVEYGNQGSINAYDQMLCVAVYPLVGDMKDVKVKFLGDGLDIPVDSLEALNTPDSLALDEDDTATIYLMWLPYMPAQSLGQVSFTMQSKKVVDIMVRSYYIQEKMGSFSITGDPNQITTSRQLHLMDSLLAESASANNLRMGNCEEEFTFDKQVEKVKENVRDLVDYLGIKTSLGGILKKNAEAKLIEYSFPAKEDVIVIKGAHKAYKNVKKINDVMKNPFFADQIKLLSDCLTIDKVANCFVKISDPNAHNSIHTGYHYVNTCKPKRNGGGPTGNAVTQWLKSLDPNEIIGPSGQGAARFITQDQTLLYQVHFENASIATAPARTVTVTDPLAPYFDYKTFKLQQIGFGDTVINLPQTAYVQANYDLPDRYGSYALAVTAGVDPGNHRAFWELRTIDPATGQLTTDPTAGFLPPNDSNGIGQGFLNYTVRLQDTVALGRIIKNQALIRFDQNGSLATNVWTNVLAGTEPQSAVSDTAYFLDSTRFRINWNGTDGIPFGTGLKGIEVYVAINNGPYQIWQPLTNARSAVFMGEVDSTYRFYSIAYDSIGNQEGAPGAPDLTVTVMEMGVINPAEGMDWDWKVAPNPFSNQLQAIISLPETREVRLEAFDVAGRRLMIFYDGLLDAGHHVLSLERAALLPKGVILLRLEVGMEAQVLKLIRME